MTKLQKATLTGCVRDICNYSFQFIKFEFVSDFEFRASNFGNWGVAKR